MRSRRDPLLALLASHKLPRTFNIDVFFYQLQLRFLRNINPQCSNLHAFPPLGCVGTGGKTAKRALAVGGRSSRGRPARGATVRTVCGRLDHGWSRGVRCKTGCPRGTSPGLGSDVCPIRSDVDVTAAHCSHEVCSANHLPPLSSVLLRCLFGASSVPSDWCFPDLSPPGTLVPLKEKAAIRNKLETRS